MQNLKCIFKSLVYDIRVALWILCPLMAIIGIFQIVDSVLLFISEVTNIYELILTLIMTFVMICIPFAFGINDDDDKHEKPKFI